MSADQIKSLVEEMGEKPYRAGQVLNWLYKSGAQNIGQMSNLSKSFRARLAERASLHWHEPIKAQHSKDGTQKLLHEMQDGSLVESVLMPEEDHHTLCVSSQVGCRMGCAFCRTATLGFRRNLTPSEIMGQVLYARHITPPDKPLTNLVFMGMGEPFGQPGITCSLFCSTSWSPTACR